MSKLVCPYCERSYHRLKRHLMTAHNMSEEEVYSLGIPLISEESSTKSSNNTKSQWSDPVKSKSIREAVAVSSSLSMKRYLTDPKYAESRSLKSTKSNNTRWANPDDSFHSPEVRSKVIEGARKGRILFWNDPDKSESRRIRSKKLSISRKALFMDPNHYLNSDQIRLNQSEAAKRVWSDPDYRSKNIDRVLKMKGGFKHYTVCLNGETRYFRSYLEVLVATKLCELGIHFEYESLRVPYVSDREHTYIPDFYLPDYNLVLEVKPKSQVDDPVVLLKRDATVNLGYFYKFITSIKDMDSAMDDLNI